MEPADWKTIGQAVGLTPTGAQQLCVRAQAKAERLFLERGYRAWWLTAEDHRQRRVWNVEAE